MILSPFRLHAESFGIRTGRKLQRDYHEEIMSCRNVQDLLKFASVCRNEPLDPVNISTILFRLAKQSKGKQIAIPESLIPRKCGSEWSPRSLASAIWAAGMLKQPEITSALQERLLSSDIESWSGRDVLSTLAGLYELQSDQASQFYLIVENCLLENRIKLKTAEIVQLVWYRSKLFEKVRINPLLEELLRDHIPFMGDQDLSMMLYSFARTDTRSDSIFEGSKIRIKANGLIDRIRECDPSINQVVANIVWAYSVCHRKKSHDIFELISTHLNLDSYCQEHLSAIILGFSKEGVTPPDFRPQHWTRFANRELLNLIWGLSRFHDTHESHLLHAVSNLSKRKIDSNDDIYALTRALALAYYEECSLNVA